MLFYSSLISVFLDRFQPTTIKIISLMHGYSVHEITLNTCEPVKSCCVGKDEQ